MTSRSRVEMGLPTNGSTIAANSDSGIAVAPEIRKPRGVMVNTESGLLGVSEISSDMRDLLKAEQSDPRAAEAIALFCYQAKKWIGALAATLGGVDTLVFSAGIGENSPVVRARICEGLEFLGITIDMLRNEKNEAVISKEGGRAAVRVIHTDEEREIAASVMTWLSTG